MSADLLALGQRGRRSHWRSPRRALRPELSARGAEAQKRIKKKGPQCSPQTLSHCVREVGEGENDPYGRDMTATPAAFCQPRFHLPGWSGNGDREAGRGRSVPELAAPGYRGRRWLTLPKPGGRATALWRASRRAGGPRRRRTGHGAGGWCFGAVRPLPGPQGTGVTWGAGLCPPRWLSAAPELIKRPFWTREASRPPGVGRAGAACGHGNNRPHSCASTKPAAQLEVNSGRLNGRFKRRHLQARPVVN